jgi:hypothetical protein
MVHLAKNGYIKGMIRSALIYITQYARSMTSKQQKIGTYTYLGQYVNSTMESRDTNRFWPIGKM